MWQLQVVSILRKHSKSFTDMLNTYDYSEDQRNPNPGPATKAPAFGLKNCPPHLRLGTSRPRPYYLSSKLGLFLPQEAHDKQGVMQLMSPGHLAKIISNFQTWIQVFPILK